MKSILGWSKQISEKLTGAPFVNAEQSVQEIIIDIKKELNRLNSEYERYEEMICITRERINYTQDELSVYLRTQAAETSRREGEMRA